MFDKSHGGARRGVALLGWARLGMARHGEARESLIMDLEDREKLVKYFEEKTAELERWGYLINKRIERLRATISIQRDIIAREKPKTGQVDRPKAMHDMREAVLW